MNAVHLREVATIEPAVLNSVRAVLTAAEAHDGIPPVSDQTLIAAAQGQRRVFTASPGPDAPVQGIGILGETEVDIVVAPEHRGLGIGRALLEHLVGIAGMATPLRAWAHGENPAANALLTRAGFVPTRSLLRMTLNPPELGRAETLTPALPAGVTVAPIDLDSPTEVSELVRVNASAFADHPEQGAMTEADFRALAAETWFDATDLLLARDETDGRVIGFTWIKTVASAAPDNKTQSEKTAQNAPLSETETELYVLGVDPATAGRGLGRALLGVTLRRMREHAPAAVSLYVDGENSRARELYERVGFDIAATSTQWTRIGT